MKKIKKLLLVLFGLLQSLSLDAVIKKNKNESSIEDRILIVRQFIEDKENNDLVQENKYLKPVSDLLSLEEEDKISEEKSGAWSNAWKDWVKDPWKDWHKDPWKDWHKDPWKDWHKDPWKDWSNWHKTI